MEHDEIKQSHSWFWLLILLIALGIVGIWIIGGIAVYTNLADWGSRGQFGDMFGSVNALFSGLAFAGLICAIFLQRHELALQREELKLQREEMAKSREQLAAQAKVQKQNLLATIAQLKITALQAEIPAEEMDSLVRTPETRQGYAQQIRNIAIAMHNIIGELESELERD